MQTLPENEVYQKMYTVILDLFHLSLACVQLFWYTSFESWGLGGSENRGAVKVWADTGIAPYDLSSSNVEALSEKAKAFVTHILNGGNTFASPLPGNCCIFEFYGLAFDLLQ